MKMHRTVLTIILAGAAGCIQAASPAIGFVMASGSFQLDRSRIWGNATLLEGNVVETNNVPSAIHLNDGSEIRLAADSRMKIFQGRAVLEKGAGQLESSGIYAIDAGMLHITAGGGGAIADVELREPGKVAVAAVKGNILVRNSQGLLVADVTPGKTVTLDAKASEAIGLTRVSGCLMANHSKLLLTDQVSNVVFEIHGEGVDKEVGNRVEIAGTVDRVRGGSGKPSQAIQVVHITRIEAGVCSSMAKSTGGGVHLSAGTVAIIGGVTVAVTVGTIEAVRAFRSSSTQSQPSTSR